MTIAVAGETPQTITRDLRSLGVGQALGFRLQFLQLGAQPLDDFLPRGTIQIEGVGLLLDVPDLRDDLLSPVPENGPLLDQPDQILLKLHEVSAPRKHLELHSVHFAGQVVQRLLAAKVDVGVDDHEEQDHRPETAGHRVQEGQRKDVHLLTGHLAPRS